MANIASAAALLPPALLSLLPSTLLCTDATGREKRKCSKRENQGEKGKNLLHISSTRNSGYHHDAWLP
jgi:hypothetical protein